MLWLKLLTLAAIGNTSSSRSAAEQHGSPDMYSSFHVF